RYSIEAPWHLKPPGLSLNQAVRFSGGRSDLFIDFRRGSKGVASLFLIEVNTPLASDPLAFYGDRKKLLIVM
ncbi:MAG: hypothetical protein JXA50_05025, partial [Deltaproteobacteria bacterium]|nr:hypothetical protein [Deltaproteobacteria bacterium]